MITGTWLRTAVGDDRLRESFTDATRRRLEKALNITNITKLSDDELRFVFNSLELEVFDCLEDESRVESLRTTAADAFQIARTLPWPNEALAVSEWIARIGCLAVLGDRSADFRRILIQESLPALPLESDDWGIRVWAGILDVWIRLFRKQGWDDLDGVQRRIDAIRNTQRNIEPAFLESAAQREDARPAWKLMAEYHLAKAAEILGIFLSQGAVDRHYDIREQLEAQFDRAIKASARGQLVELETFSRLLARAARIMVDNSIWTVTRAVNSRVTRFVELLTDRNRCRPIFEMLPPQRRTLSEQGLLGSSHRSVVLSLPTSSGKTFITDSLKKKGMDELMAEEFSIFPGLEELFSLLRLKELYDSGKYDVAIIDCAPTGATIRMLGVPSVFRWYFDKFFHLERRIAKVIKPVVERMYDEVLLPTDEVFYSLEEIYERVYNLNRVLTDPEVTSVRLVCSPEKMVIKESQRAYTYLNLFGYGVDAVIANRVLPEVSNDSYFHKWKKIQQKYLRYAEETFHPLKVFRSPLFGDEMVGTKQLKKMARHIFGDSNPATAFYKERPFTLEKEDGKIYLSVRIPYARKEQIGAWVKGEELFLEWGDFKANTLLPSHLLEMNLQGAQYTDGFLRITFEGRKDE